jgi:diguanylate cyclase (GGDEF)-like protein
VREVDLVARVGGEEFALLLLEQEGVTAQKTMERLLANMRAMPVKVNDGLDLPVTLSAGVAGLTSAQDPGALVAAADAALYAAKSGGRDRVVLAGAD